MGRGKADPHRKIEEKEGRIPTIACDYCFMGKKSEVEEADASTLPIIVHKCDKDRWITAHACKRKGAERKVVDICAREIASSGYASFLYKSDQEPAILDFVRQVAGDETMKIELMESPVGESQANSLVERSIWDVEGLTRTLVCFVEAYHGVKLEPTHPLRLWAIEYAGQLYNSYSKSSEDGRIPYELRRGRPFRRRLP